MIEDKTLSAENGYSLFKDSDAVFNHLADSRWASREEVVRGVTPLAKDAPLPARRVLRATPFRLAGPANITLKEY
jgi:hypothetical protein